MEGNEWSQASLVETVGVGEGLVSYQCSALLSFLRSLLPTLMGTTYGLSFRKESLRPW